MPLAEETVNYAFDSDHDISPDGLSDKSSVNVDLPLELSSLNAGPSPIASAAAEVSDRLDALMADNAPLVSDADSNLDRKVLQFTPRKDERKSIDDKAAVSAFEAAKSSSRGSSNLYNDMLVDESAVDVNATEGGDSATRYIQHDKVRAPKRAGSLPLNIMVILGMILCLSLIHI